MSAGRTLRLFKTLGVACAAAALLSGCISATANSRGVYATPIGNAPVTANPTPYSAALYCMADYARRYSLPSPRMAVGRIADYTGTVSADGGRQVTGGASLMAMTALAKSGARMVERYDTSISEMELRYANNRLIGDEGPGGADDIQYRRIIAGSVPGSDFYIIGGITEVNHNIRSGGFDMAAGQASTDTPLSTAFAGRAYVMNIAIDLRLVQTTTNEVVDVVSYQKQIIGREISAGVFDFLNGNVFDISAGEGGLEPVQLAVRAVVERAVVEMMANLYGVSGPEACLDAANDPLGGRTNTAGVTGAFIPAYDNLGTNNAATRQDPSRWNADRDDNLRRGRY
jgi:curli production assembly/transport component CsgG/holdfast attachment protein HfaB